MRNIAFVLVGVFTIAVTSCSSSRKGNHQKERPSAADDTAVTPDRNYHLGARELLYLSERKGQAYLQARSEARRKELILILERAAFLFERKGELDPLLFIRRVLNALEPTRTRRREMAAGFWEVGRYRYALGIYKRLLRGARGADARRLRGLVELVRRNAAQRQIGLPWPPRKNLRALHAKVRKASFTGRLHQAVDLIRRSNDEAPSPEKLIWMGRVMERIGGSRNASRLYARALALVETLSEHDPVLYLALGHSRVFQPWFAKKRVVKSTIGHEVAVCGVAMGQKGKYAVSADGAGHTKIWETLTGRLLRDIQQTEAVSAIAVGGANQRHLIIASDSGTIKVRDLLTGGLLRTLHGPRWRTLAVAADRKWIAAVGASLCVWDLTAGSRMFRIRAHRNVIRTVAIGAHGKLIATGGGRVGKRYLGSDDAVKVWRAETGERVATLRGHASHVTSLSFDPSGTWLASGSADGTVKLWDVRKKKCLRTLDGHGDWVTALALGNGGKMLVSGDARGLLYYWDPRTGSLLEKRREHDGKVTSLAISGQGDVLISGGNDATVKLFDLRGHVVAHAGPGRPEQVAERNRNLPWLVRRLKLAASSGGGMASLRIVASGGESSIRVMDTTSGRLLISVAFWNKHREWLAYTPDGYVDASRGGRQAVRWRVGRFNYDYHLAWQRFHVPGLVRRVLHGDASFRLSALRRLQ